MPERMPRGVTRRLFLTRAAGASGAPLVYEAMSRGSWASHGPATRQATATLRRPEGRVHLAGDRLSSMNSWMQGAFESAREVAMAIHSRALTRS